MKISFGYKLGSSFAILLITAVIFVIGDVSSASGDSNVILIAGGIIGTISAGVVFCGILADYGPDKSLLCDFLFWRAFSDLGIGLRFAFNAQWNIYSVGTAVLNASENNPIACSFPSGYLEFFGLASQFWVVVVAIDLIRTLTYPFSNTEKWGKLYFIGVWGVSLVCALVTGFNKNVYGFYYVDVDVDSSSPTAICFIKNHKHSTNQMVYILFYIPILGGYLICFAAIVYAFYRLRNGIPSTLIPRIRAASANTINIVTYLILNGCLLVPMSVAYVGSNEVSGVSIRLVWFIVGGQGVSALLVWILATDTVDLSASLRQDILTFATSGIRTCIPLEETACDDDVLIYIQPDVEPNVGKMDVWFLLRFMFGDEAALLRLVKMQMENRNRRSIAMDEIDVETASAARHNTRLSNLLIHDVTPPDNKSAVCVFKEIQPAQFRRIRHSQGLTSITYRNQFLQTAKEKVTRGGASGAFFFFSNDDLFLAKSCTKSEFQFLSSSVKLFADYFESDAGRNSFIGKIFGVYSLSLYGIQLYFFVMSNLFSGKDHNGNPYDFEERYDLKGSTVNRSVQYPNDGDRCTCKGCKKKFIYTKKSSANPKFSAQSSNNSNSSFYEACSCTVSGTHEPNLLCKDNDLKYKLRMHLSSAKAAVAQLESDAEFLSHLGIMDYSLLLGVHHREFVLDRFRSEMDDDSKQQASFSTSGLPSPQHSAINVALEMSSKRFKAISIVGADFYQFGVIDFLQEWNFNKKWERFFKVHILGQSSFGLSAIEPRIYRDRFLSHIRNVFGMEENDAGISSLESNSAF